MSSNDLLDLGCELGALVQRVPQKMRRGGAGQYLLGCGGAGDDHTLFSRGLADRISEGLARRGGWLW